MKVDHRKVEKMVPKRFYWWLKVFWKVESERILRRGQDNNKSTCLKLNN